MALLNVVRKRTYSVAITVLSVALVIGWALRERTFAQEKAAQLQSDTVNLEKVAMKDFSYEGERVGKVGVYLMGDTPASTKFVTGRFVLEPGKTPHAPHTHA